MKIRQFMVAVSALTLAGTFAMPAAAKGYAVCAFTATLTPRHNDYGDYNGKAWVDVVYFDNDDLIPTERALQQAFADYVRAGDWSDWNPRFDNETVDCAIIRNAAPGQGGDNRREWEAQYKSGGWKVTGKGGIYWWDEDAGYAHDPLIQNGDWRGPTRHR